MHLKLLVTTGGDGKALLETDHPTIAGTFSNELATSADLSETSLEQAMIDIAKMTDERGLKIAAKGNETNHSPSQQFIAERIMKSANRVGTADNDINALASNGNDPTRICGKQLPI